MTAVMPQMLNLGCGHRFHPAWVNVDIVPATPEVTRWDVVRGIPFPDQHFDVVYHSHMIEHLRRSDVPGFLRECHRALKPGGIMRVATPDLERLCAVYLEELRASDAANHEWMVIELLDQTVREKSGGGMLDYLRQQPLANEDFVLERIGEEGRGLLQAVRGSSDAHRAASPNGFKRRLGRAVRRQSARVREALLRKWYGDDALEALAIGKFRLSGEVHQWLYDRASLARVLVAAGFCDPVVRGAAESTIPGWSAFSLDTTAAGAVFKPDSMFMEVRRPL